MKQRQQHGIGGLAYGDDPDMAQIAECDGFAINGQKSILCGNMLCRGVLHAAIRECVVENLSRCFG